MHTLPQVPNGRISHHKRPSPPHRWWHSLLRSIAPYVAWLTWRAEQHPLRMAGRGWYGHWLGDCPLDLRSLETQIDNVFVAVRDAVRADFACPRTRLPPLGLVCGDPSAVGLHVRDLGLDAQRTADVTGRFYTGWSEVFVGGDPRDAQFLGSLAHELAHAVCYWLLGGLQPAFWASEGYADLVSQIIAPTDEDYWTQCRTWLGSHTHVIDLRRLLAFCEEPGKSFHDLDNVQAALLVAYLYTFRESSGPVWQLVRAGLSSNEHDAERTCRMFEDAFGLALDEIEQRFHVYVQHGSFPP